MATVDRFEPEAGMSMCPLCSVLLSGCRLGSEDALFWRGLCCSTEAQDGEEAEEEEEERGRSGGEAGVTVGSSFSIMLVMSLGEIPVSTKLLFLSAAQRVCVCHWFCPSCLYKCVRITNMFMCTTCRLSYRALQMPP